MRFVKTTFACFAATLVASICPATEPQKPKANEPPVEEVKPGKSTNARGARNLRWEIGFGKLSATDYLKQVDALGMFLVVPDKDGNPFRVADLAARPAKLEAIKDLRAWKRNWFTDDRDESCKSVAAELQLAKVPAALLFFYPFDFEKQLLAKELEFKGRKETEIEYTKFKVTLKDGKPLIEVIEQKPFKEEKKP